MSTETTSAPAQIHARILDVQAAIGAIAKGRRNEQQGYNYRGYDDIADRLHPLFAEHRIYLAPTVVEHQREHHKNNKGTELHFSIVKVRYTFRAEDGSAEVVDVMGEGFDSGDKSLNKAMTAAWKTAVCQTFSIPINDRTADSEHESHEVAPRPARVAYTRPNRPARRAEVPHDLGEQFAPAPQDVPYPTGQGEFKKPGYSAVDTTYPADWREAVDEKGQRLDGMGLVALAEIARSTTKKPLRALAIVGLTERVAACTTPGALVKLLEFLDPGGDLDTGDGTPRARLFNAARLRHKEITANSPAPVAA